MAAIISLTEVIEAVESSSDDAVSYLDPQTGEIITVTEDDRLLLEEGDSVDMPEWQRALLPKIRAALNEDRFLELPSRFDVHEWSIMERFAHEQDADGTQQELLNAIHGSGAFRAFKSVIRRLGVEQGWYQFRDEAFAQIVRDWLEEHGLAYK